MQPNQIPANPQIAQQIAAVGESPAQVHQGAPAGIPSHPGVAAQQARPNVDFFARMAMSEDEVDLLDPQVAPQDPQVPIPPPNVDLVNVDDLLSGGQFPEPPQAPPPQEQQGYQAPPAPQAPAAPPQQQTPEDLQRLAIDYLRDNTYKFDDAMTRQALSEPEVALPMLAARLHVNLVNEFAQQVQRVVPVLVERETQRRMAVMEAKNDFFRRYPKLNRPEWEGTIAESIQLAAQMHQGKPRDQIMAEGAALAVYRLRSSASRPQAPNRSQPYVPASPGSGGPAVPMNPSQGMNPWIELAQDPDLFS